VTEQWAVDSERDDHLLALGRAVAEWANVEERLYGLVLLVLGCDPRHGAIIFYRTPTLEQRLQLLDDLLKTVFPQPSDNPGAHDHPDYRDWCNLMSDLRREMPIRNRLAHQPVGLWADVYQHDESKEITIGPLLIGTSNSHAEALKKGKSDIPLRLEDIDAHTKRVMAFPERLLSFGAGPLARRLKELPIR
jgi:hypothetical protein